ncbi:hypothetical protein HPB50_000588 [Hyalomma asiaticum]|uniref:Uncharacterized protein n=1 Tax=Hyalomma asiaticum TaxID=266040 RepID=A0ACB7RHL2_HYAAI|nr:hypothetical protein HPB50_000588 [Hyalomma asiaticum]
MVSRKRKPLLIKEKANSLAVVDRTPKRKQIDIANKLGLPASTVNTVVSKRKETETNAMVFSGATKQARGARHGELKEALLKWFKQVWASGISFDGTEDTVRSEDDYVDEDCDIDEEFLSTGADVPFAEFVAIDKDVPTCEPQSIAEIVAEVVGDDGAEVVADEAHEDSGEEEGLTPKRKQIDIANKLGLPASTVNPVVSKRKEIEMNAMVFSGTTKQARGARHGERKEALLKWFKQAWASGINFDGSVLKEKALKVADILGIDDFTASNGWISRFRARHGIAYWQVNGEAASVNLANVRNKHDQPPAAS